MSTEKYSLQAINDKVVVEPFETKETKSPGGIVLAHVMADQPWFGKVLSVGEGRCEGGSWVSPRVAVGDTVVYRKNAGQFVEIGGKRLLVMREDEIFGIVKP